MTHFTIGPMIKLGFNHLTKKQENLKMQSLKLAHLIQEPTTQLSITKGKSIFLVDTEELDIQDRLTMIYMH